MMPYFLKIAFRALWRQKGYSLINMISLALGLGCSILILHYVRYELSYDQYHEKKDRLYRLATEVQGSLYGSIAKVNGPWGPAARAEIPEIEDLTRFVYAGNILLGSGDLRFYEPNGLYADSSALAMFSYHLRSGDVRRSLTEPRSIVLTRTLSRKYFGSEDPVGKTLMMENTTPLRVTGVIDDVPLNSHFTFDFLLSMGTLTHPDRENWIRWNQFYTYLLLREGAQPSTVESKLPAILVKNMGHQGAVYKPFLQKVTSIHLHSNLFRELEPNSDISYVYIMLSVAVFVLLIGCMNYMNIATARATLRAKEVGVRKASGAGRAVLSRQFFGETLLFSFLCLPIAGGLVELALPLLNELTNRHIEVDWIGDPFLVPGMLILGGVVGVLAGAYPSLVLSSFNPLDVLKGTTTASRGKRLRKGLVVAQFALSAFFLVATGVVLDQLSYIRSARLGFNKEQLLVVPITDPSLANRAEAIKSELLSNPSVLRVSATANFPGGSDYGIPAEPDGIPKDRVPPLRIFAGDQDLIATLEVSMSSGRPFSRAFASDTSAAFIINEEAARQLGWDEPLEHAIAMPTIDRPAAPVIGVVQDFHFRSMHEKIAPLLMLIPPPAWYSSFIIRVAPGSMNDALSFLRGRFETYDPGHPFRYTFFDEQYETLHASEERMGRLLTAVSVLAVALASLGLFGLAAYNAETRTKEIGVRKVLGASVSGIARLLASDFLRLVVIANLLAFPVVYYVMRLWLQEFAYRTSIDPLTFIMAGIAAGAVATFAVGAQAIRAGLINPVEALRYE